MLKHEGMSVLFHHATVAVVESANGSAPSLPADAIMTNVGRTQADLKYFVLVQKGATANHTGQTPHEWQHAVVAMNPKVRTVWANGASLRNACPLCRRGAHFPLIGAHLPFVSQTRQC